LAADGRGLQDVAINDNFAKLSESLYIAERNAREEVAKRAAIQKKLAVKEKEKKEELLRRLAQEARDQRKQGPADEEEQDHPHDHDDDDDDVTEEDLAKKAERDRIREERRKERERERRLAAKKSKLSRDDERDVSEKIALGQMAPQQSQETLYDQRLFNQSQGLDSGFGNEDSYNIYNKPLFSGSSANVLYRPKKSDTELYGGEEEVEKLLKTSKFKPDKDFEGVDRTKATEARTRPVEFEKEEDPFGLDAFLNEAKSGKKALDSIGKGGHLHAAATSETKSKESYSSSKRSTIEFEKRK
jgi:SNW domain-containing protein 1